MIAPVVGFDLDMTLIDTRPGIGATYRALCARTGVYVDVDAVVARLGPPLAQEIANWFPAERVEEAVGIFRELYPAYAVGVSRPLPGAEAALAAVRNAGGRSVVITSKLDTLARLHLDHLGLAVDAVAGDRYGPGKTAALREHGAQVFVGDHLADVRAAVAAGVRAVGVATGPYGPADLRAAGAEVVLDDLRGFPQWLASTPIAADAPTGTG